MSACRGESQEHGDEVDRGDGGYRGEATIDECKGALGTVEFGSDGAAHGKGVQCCAGA